MPTRSGSNGSSATRVSELPFFTEQKWHLRVQRSPIIMNVAVWCDQHSPMFGHIASSHTVWSLRSLTSFFVSRYSGEPGARTLSHEGFTMFVALRGTSTAISSPLNGYAISNAGNSRASLKYFKKVLAITPSMMRWSTDTVAFITEPTTIWPF